MNLSQETGNVVSVCHFSSWRPQPVLLFLCSKFQKKGTLVFNSLSSIKWDLSLKSAHHSSIGAKSNIKFWLIFRLLPNHSFCWRKTVKQEILVKQEIYILYHFTESTINCYKETIWSYVYGYHSPTVIWRGTGEQVLCAIVLVTRTAIMLEHILHDVTELYVQEWYFVVGLEVWSWLGSSWSDNLHQWLFYKFAPWETRIMWFRSGSCLMIFPDICFIWYEIVLKIFTK